MRSGPGGQVGSGLNSVSRDSVSVSSVIGKPKMDVMWISGRYHSVLSTSLNPNRAAES